MLTRIIAAGACVACAAPAFAERHAVATASLGAGAWNARPAASLALGVDVTGPSYAVGFGGLIHLHENGVRSAEWDEASEWATLLRYAVFTTQGDDVSVSAVAGELGPVSLGGGHTLGWFMSGLDIDHRSLGTHVVVRTERGVAELLIDDVVSPEIIGAAASREFDWLRAEATAAVDLAAPTMRTTEVAWASSVGVHAEGRRGRKGGSLGVTGLAQRGGVGVAMDGAVRAEFGGGVETEVGATVGVGNRGFVPVYFDASYRVTRNRLGARPSRLDALSDMPESGMFYRGHAAVKIVDRMNIDAAYLQRPAMPGLGFARVTAFGYEKWQAAVAVAAEVGADVEFGAGAVETRVVLPKNLFAMMQLGRVYRTQDGSAFASWFAMAAVGGSVSE